MIEHWLCVGGPWDRRMYAHPRDWFEVYEQGSLPPPIDFAAAQDVCDFVVQKSNYQKERVGPGIYVWQHSSLTYEAMMQRLLQAYKERK